MWSVERCTYRDKVVWSVERCTYRDQVVWSVERCTYRDQVVWSVEASVLLDSYLQIDRIVIGNNSSPPHLMVQYVSCNVFHVMFLAIIHVAQIAHK